MRIILLLSSLLFLATTAIATPPSFIIKIEKAIKSGDYSLADQLIGEQLLHEAQLSKADAAAVWYFRGLLNQKRHDIAIKDWPNALPFTKLYLANSMQAFEKSFAYNTSEYQVLSLHQLNELFQTLRHLSVRAYQEEQMEQFYYFARNASHCNLFVFKHSPTPYDWDAPVLLFAAHASELTGRNEEAITWYLRMIDLGAHQIHNYTNACRLYVRQGDIASAINILDYGLVKHPYSQELLQLKTDLSSRLHLKLPTNAACKRFVRQYSLGQA